tara:strand:+ start:3971 stop:4408 length:438 start_codon:yes stop_codon:yes gene_type:complete
MENRVLKSNFPKEWKGFEVRELQLSDIWPSVPIATTIRGRPFYESVKDDIARDGMHFPVMAVHSKYDALEKAKEKWGEKISPLPFWHNSLGKNKKWIWGVWGGSNRVRIAQDLGYTHIDAVIIPTIGQAISLQKHMRKPFDKYYK